MKLLLKKLNLCAVMHSWRRNFGCPPQFSLGLFEISPNFLHVRSRTNQAGEEMGRIRLLALSERYKKFSFPLNSPPQKITSKIFQKCSLWFFSLSLVSSLNSSLVKQLHHLPIPHNVFSLVPCNFVQLHNCNVSVSIN